MEERKQSGKKGTVKVGIMRSTIRTYWSKLSNFFEWLCMRGYIEKNPFSGMRRPTVVYENMKYLKKQDIERILAALHNHSTNILLYRRNLAMFYTLLFCGLRRSELLLLQLQDIDFEKKTMTIRAENSKIPRVRILPLHSQVCMYLKDYIKERKHLSTPYLFASWKHDTRITNEGMSTIVESLQKPSRVKFHLHQFRHTFAVNFLKSSNNIVKLKQLKGQTDIRMIMVYLRCLPTHEMRADVEHMNIDDFI